jgi:hypothetical protein
VISGCYSDIVCRLSYAGLLLLVVFSIVDFLYRFRFCVIGSLQSTSAVVLFLVFDFRLGSSSYFFSVFCCRWSVVGFVSTLLSFVSVCCGLSLFSFQNAPRYQRGKPCTVSCVVCTHSS